MAGDERSRKNLDLFAWQPRETKTNRSQPPPVATPKQTVPKAATQERPPSSSGRKEATPPRAESEPLTVSQLNRAAQRLLESKFSRIRLTGEISNHRRHASGHHYFTLKDDGAQVAAVMFRREADRLPCKLTDGLQVVVECRVTIYDRNGRYQVIVDRAEEAGAGALQAAFEKLKERLRREGLFDPSKKRPLPQVPKRVAVLTSATGAVIRDIIDVSRRRFAGAQLLLVPCLTNGAESSVSIRKALKRTIALVPQLNIDVIILARGGGSLEDLWGFNDEALVRELAASPVPIVSAVGHETDFTLVDFVADHRAPTPSAAAELVFPVRHELVDSLARYRQRLGTALRRKTEVDRHRLESVTRRLNEIRQRRRDEQLRIIELERRIVTASQKTVSEHRRRLSQTEHRIQQQHPKVRMVHARTELRGHSVRIKHLMLEAMAQRRSRHALNHSRLVGHRQQVVQGHREHLNRVMAQLDAMSPLKVLDRGYSITSLGGEVLSTASAVKVGDEISVRLGKGRITAEVTKTGLDESPAKVRG